MPAASEPPVPQFVTVSPEPTEDELAAILSAYGQLWPAETAPVVDTRSALRWKFSRRWWVDGRTQRGPVSGWR